MHTLTSPSSRRRSIPALVALAALVAALVVMVGASSQADADEDIALAPDDLVVDPLVGGGVTGFVQPSVSSQHWRAHAFAQIDDRLFVGGAFTTVTETPFAGAPTHAQPFIAAFDLDTNEYIETWTPTLDDAVWALEVYNGNLIVGGEFDTVNGVAREGLVALDPISGAIVSQFDATVANDGSNYEASVRTLQVVGDDLYVAGDYNRLVEGPWRHGRYRLARVNATTGKIDNSWIPRISGGGIYDLEVDTVHGKVYVVGSFTSADAQPSTRSSAVIDPVTGSVIPGHPFSFNGNYSHTYGVALAGDRVFIGGEQHYLQARSRTDWTYYGCTFTGYTSLNDPANCQGGVAGGAGAGGDFQVVESFDGLVIAGCHCRGNHWNSVLQVNTDLDDRGFRIYDADLNEFDFLPNATHWNEGPYAAFKDTNGCLYIGGDFTGEVDGFARYCGEVSEPLNVTGAPVGQNISLSWNEPAMSGSGIDHYRVLRDGAQIATTTETTYVDTSVVPNTTYTYTVTAHSTTEVAGPASTPVVVTSGGADVTPPSVPGNVVLSTDGVSQVDISWDASTDDSGVAGYLVHRDWQFIGWTAGDLSFVDNNVVQNEEYRYEIRAFDAAGNISDPSPAQYITIEQGPDVTPPSVPGNVVLSTDGVSQVDISWDASTDDRGVYGYLVHRDWQYLGWTTDLSFVDNNVVQNQEYRYEIRAFDAAFNISNPSPAQYITVEQGPDVTPPSTPPNPTAVVDANGDVQLNWDAATDDRGVTGYLVHRDWQYLGYTTSLDFLDDTAVSGQTHRYRIRAQDAAGNNSAPTEFLFVTVP